MTNLHNLHEFDVHEIQKDPQHLAGKLDRPVIELRI